MTDVPRVSAIVPVWDGERFLADCLDSILAQGYAGLEVVVVDDGSTDGSAEIAEAHEGVRVLRRAHAGLAPARNAGVEAATGALIAWCDADDVWRPGKLERQVSHLVEHPGCDVILARMAHRFEEGAEWPAWLRRDQRFGDLDGVAMTSGVFRREVFDRVGGFLDQPGTDFDLLIRARTAGCTIDVLDAVVHERRIHDQNMMTSTPPERAGATNLMPSVRAHMRRRRRA